MKKLIMLLLGVGLLLGVIACSENVKKEDDTLQASDVVDRFITEGLEADGSRDMKPEDYGPLPQTAVSAQIFYLPTIGDKVNGHVYVFDNRTELEDMIAAYEEHSGMFKVWLFDNDLVLLHLSGMVGDVDAKDYEAALNKIK